MHIKTLVSIILTLALSSPTYADIFENRKYEYGMDAAIGSATLLLGFLLSPITGEDVFQSSKSKTTKSPDKSIYLNVTKSDSTSIKK